MTNKKFLILSLFLLLSANCFAAPRLNGVKIGFAHCCSPTNSALNIISETIQTQAKKDRLDLVFATADEESSEDESLQLEQIKTMVNKDKVKSLLILLTADNSKQKEIFEFLAQSKVPTVFVYRQPRTIFTKKCPFCYTVSSPYAQAGVMQGELVYKMWKAHPEWDLNKDGVLQYAVVKSSTGDITSENYTKWALKTLNESPEFSLKNEQITLEDANFNKNRARNIVRRWVNSGLIDNIEVLISNHDEISMGMIEGLKDEDGKEIKRPLFSIGSTENGMKALKEGKISATVRHNFVDEASIALKIAENLATEQEANAGMEIDILGRAVFVPFEKLSSDDNVK